VVADFNLKTEFIEKAILSEYQDYEMYMTTGSNKDGIKFNEHSFHQMYDIFL
jgi:hypothetical protein